MAKSYMSWDDVEKGAADFSDGHNVVLHEFAHQLDGLLGSTDGAPPLRPQQLPVLGKSVQRQF